MLATAATIAGKVTTLSPDKPAGISVTATNYGTGQDFGGHDRLDRQVHRQGPARGPLHRGLRQAGRHERALLRTADLQQHPRGPGTPSPTPVWLDPGEAQAGIDAALARGAVITRQGHPPRRHPGRGLPRRRLAGRPPLRAPLPLHQGGRQLLDRRAQHGQAHPGRRRAQGRRHRLRLRPALLRQPTTCSARPRRPPPPSPSSASTPSWGPRRTPGRWCTPGAP